MSARFPSLLGVAAAALAFASVGHAGGTTKWEESFDRPSLDWVSPSRHDASTVKRVFAVVKDERGAFLRAAHDATKRPSYSPPPAVHYGHAFPEDAVPLTQACVLEWQWRVLQHPTVGSDPWEDVAGSVYVVFKTPSLFSGGRGFKLGWLARSGPTGTKQRGLLQVEVRHDAAGQEWRSERVDLCALYKNVYGDPAGESVRYVGVVTDADGTKSEARADYRNFKLSSM